MRRRVYPLLLFVPLLAAAAGWTSLAPNERILGSGIPIVYLHGAWVWTALIGLGAATLAGAAGLAFRRPGAQRWSLALGQAGTLFWVTYLPLCLLAMQASWNGLFLEEPRWRIGVDFAVIGVLLQAAILAIHRPAWASAINLGFLAALAWSLAGARQVVHPPSPIFSSESVAIRLYFMGLLILCLLAGWQLTGWLRARAG
jgi:hypothetical protein